MPARRSARPVSKPEPPKRVAKRAASPENPPPPPKRTKSDTKHKTAETKLKLADTNKKADDTKKSSASKSAPTRRGRPPTSKATPKAPPSYLNALPIPPDHPRPANQIFVWGAGNFGQFGMGPDHLGEFDKPKKNPWVEEKMTEGAFGGENAGIECVVAGGMHTMFVDEDGTIWTCGVNDDAALGRITKDVPDPNCEGSFLDVDFLTSVPHPLQSLVDEKFRTVSIAAGDNICAAISSEGELRVWGSFRANEGSLGFSDGSKYQHLPAPILQLPSRLAEKVVSVAAGGNHLVVLTTHGHIYTWGAGEQGQLGRKILERRKIHGTNPEKVALHSRSRKGALVGAGQYNSFAVDHQGVVWGWGLNNMGQTGTGFEDEGIDTLVPQPLRVVGLSKEELGGATIIEINGGEHHTLFLASDGRVFACGRTDGGQIGLPDDHPALNAPAREGMVPEPTLIPFPDDDDPVVHISAGPRSSMAVTQSGALYAWGEGNQGELGIGEESEAKTPKMIVRRAGGLWKAIAIACGGQHSLGLFRKKS